MKKNFYISIMALLLLCSSAFAAKRNVVYVRSPNNYRDSITIDAIAGYKDSSIYQVTQLLRNRILQSDLAQLNAADVVIMGRNIPSGDVGATKGVWDSITKPVIGMNMYGIRKSRANWFNTPNDNITNAGSTGSILKAVVLKPNDTVMADLADTVDWWMNQYNIFQIKDSVSGGEVLARTLDSIPLFVRWKAGVEFYTGAGHFPLAERTFLGCGSDAGGTVNYFAFTDPVKKVFFKELGRMAGVPVAVIYVRSPNNYRDSVTIDAIAKYADSSMFQVTQLLRNRILQSDLAQLNAADVVIMGRNIPSGDVGATKGVWDSITKPVIGMNMYGIRKSRANWFNTPNDNITNAGSTGSILKAVVLKPNDTVMADLADTVDWWMNQYNIFQIKDSVSGGEVLARTLDSIPLFVRWKAGVEFYTGAGHFPLAERTFIGCGSDAGGVVSYFNFTGPVKEVFFKELLRMGSMKVVDLPLRQISTLSALMPSFGALSPALTPAIKNYTITVPYGSTNVPTLTATATDPAATLDMDNAASLTDSSVITVTAQDTTVESVYVVKFAIGAPSTVATLSALTVSAGNLNPAFNTSVTEYTNSLPAGTTAVPTITLATPTDPNATIVIADAASLSEDATVTVTAQDGATTKIYTISFAVAVGIDGISLSDVRIYPSPVNDVLYITNVKEAVVSIYSIDGVLLNKVNLLDNKIDVSNLSRGTYLINIWSEGKTLNTRFVKN